MSAPTAIFDNCPLPEVAEALSPYIKQRDEVSAIRRGLQSHLRAQLQTDGAPVSSVNLLAPGISHSQLGPPPLALSGVRKAYWKALHAHAAAQAQYDTLRDELDRLKHQPSRAGLDHKLSSASVNEHYIPLLRQREKQRKLKAIEAAYSEIISTGGEISASSFEDVVKQQIGELPTPPSTQPVLGRESDAEAKILELKKTILSTKRGVDQREKGSPSSKPERAAVASPLAEISGLQRALEELTTWMESQLTVIANSEADTQSLESPGRNGNTSSTALSERDIASLYTQYLAAKRRLIMTVNSTFEVKSEDSNNDFISHPTNSPDAIPPDKSSAEIILPYIPTLVATKQEEQALMLQNAYVRRCISAAETENERLLHRLANESHLVQSTAVNGKAWADAAREAVSALDIFAKGRVEAGEAFAESAHQALEKTRTLPASLDRLMETIQK